MYASVHIAITAAFLENNIVMEQYLDLARKIREVEQRTRITSWGQRSNYPICNLLANHEKTFINRIIGQKGKLKNEQVMLLKGHSHVVARNAKILRVSDKALETIISISKDWKKPLEKDDIKARLEEFEHYLLKQSGTIHVSNEYTPYIQEQMKEAK